MSALIKKLLNTRVLPMGLRTLSEVTKVQPTVTSIPSYSDQLNPIPGYDYHKTESHPIPGINFKDPPPAETGVHAVTGEVVKFPYFHCRDACYDGDLTIAYQLILKKDLLISGLTGSSSLVYPKGADEVYKVKGTDVGESGPTPDLWRYKYEIPAVNEAYLFWRKYGTLRSDNLPEEQFDAMWLHFFNNPLLDIFELRRGCNIVHDLDMIPEPALVEQMFYACRRLNDYPMTLRLLEGIKNKIPKDPVVYQWVLQELAPVMEELGIKTPDELGLHIAPEGKGPLPY
ncbi:uncharacterized protein LOC134813201 [Bolinopsis microptera]|uniref:uncharacterized protein LOC134813201 n=1 Tax=Bolinopsis microptera TaxID=2820187 RepID=UPI0030790693